MCLCNVLCVYIIVIRGIHFMLVMQEATTLVFAGIHRYVRGRAWNEAVQNRHLSGCYRDVHCPTLCGGEKDAFFI